MNAKRTWMAALTLTLCGAAAFGCSKKEAQPPTEKADAAATANPALKGKLNFRNPAVLPPKVPPQIVKEYRVDACYFGTLTLRQARDAYLASLGKAEPSEQKLPNFGAPLVPSTQAAPAATPSAAPGATAAPTAEGAGTAAPKPAEPPMRANYERSARTCAVALGTKDFPMPEVDAVLAEYAPFAQELSKKIVEAHGYYSRGEHKADQLARGKALHKELVERFAKLDAMQEKLRAAIEGWRKDHPADTSKDAEGTKTAQAAIDAGRALVYRLLVSPLDAKAFATDVAGVEAAVQKVKAFGDSSPTDPWGRGMLGAFETLVKALKDSKPSASGLSADDLLGVTQAFTRVVEARQRAVARALAGKSDAPRALPPQVVPAGTALPLPEAH